MTVGMMTVGIVSAGHMGSGLGWALRSGGVSVVTTVDGRSARTAGLAEAAGLTVLPTLADVLRASEILLVVTPPGAALDAATRVSATARELGVAPLVADLNAIAPSTVDRVAAEYASAGMSYVDGSISGPPPIARPGARVYLSGERATEIADLPWEHAHPIVLPGPAGRASALKMCTASVYKGLNGLVAQAMRAAAHYGVLDEVLDDLGRDDLGQVTQVVMAATKAHRFVPEMEQIALAQGAAGLTPALFEAFARVYEEIAATPLGQEHPETVDRTMSAQAVVDGITPRR